MWQRKVSGLIVLLFALLTRLEKWAIGASLWPQSHSRCSLLSWLTQIFLGDESGRRPIYGGTTKFQSDPYWKDYILFYEYFHGDNGAGLGASHQTGWTGVVAKLIEFFGRIDGQQLLDAGKAAAFAKKEPTRDKQVA